MSDSTVFNAGQSLRRREMMKAAVVGAAGVTAGAASSGTVAADDDGFMPDPSLRHAFVNPGLEALYNYVTSFGDEGYTKESVHEMTEENAHLRIYQGADANTREVGGALTSLQNYIRPDDPLASSQAEMVFSELRTTALQAVQDGKSSSEASSEGYEAAMEELSIPYINLYRQWNEHAYNIVHYALTFYDGDEIEWTEEFDHDDGETLQGFDPVSLSDIEGLPDVEDVLRLRQSIGDATWTDLGVDIAEKTLPNGDTHPVYELVISHASTTGQDDDVHTIDHNEQDNPLLILHPDDSSEHGDDASQYVLIDGPSLGFPDILDALEDIRSEVSSEATDTIEEIMDAHAAGDIGDMDVMSSYDLMRKYGDSDDMTRYTAELLAAGLDAQEDVSQAVTIDHPDIGERTGRLFLSWNWDTLADWEYEYEDGVFEVDSSSIDDDPDLELVFEDGSVTVEADDLEDGTADVDDDGLGDLEHVERHSQGELRSHIPVGEETDHWDSAIFLFEDDETTEHRTLDTSEPFELVSVEDDGDELDSLELTGWENTTRDPARALEEAERTADQYQTVEDLEETGHGGGGGGGDTNTLLVGGVVLALVGMILAALMGDS